MGSKQSTLTTTEIKELPQKQAAPPSSESGRKQSTSDSVLEEPPMISIKAEDSDESSCRDSDDSDDYSIGNDSDEDEEWNERIHILQDARNLRTWADFFMSPEKPVLADSTAKARCYFSRASAAEVTSVNDELERARILADAQALKEQAVFFLCPEIPVETSDSYATGRNYFNRPSAPTNEEEDERALILADALALKKLAVDYLHPEKPVVTSDPYATGRNFFTRYSAEGVDDSDLAEEREQILAESQALKKLAVDYLHPELPVVTSDPCATGRNYFSRPSAEEYEDEEHMDDRDEILEDMAELKRLAQDYLHPERPVQVDPLAFCRNYFDRPSAISQDDVEEMEEQAKIMADAQALKQLAIDYLHPEKPVVTSDPCATGRNYFTRASADDSEEYSEERTSVLADVAALKKLAVDYMHPEKPVVVDGFAMGRNYFSRCSAEAQEDEDTMYEREDILMDAMQLKSLARDYMHPERPVIPDPLLFGRNFFNRPSAPTNEEEDERALILADALALKKLAVDYLHPEKPVVTSDPCATGRNFFTRYSAEGVDDSDLAEEREQILAESQALKKLAVDYLHPELPVVTSDPCATGRNYFSRPSAEEYEDEEHMDDRDDILEDMAELKRLAQDYLHPERPVQVDPLAFCRNYFDRPSAISQDDVEEMEEQAKIMADAQALKQLAIDYLHPEKPVVTSDPCATGRNYFTRASAEEYDVKEDSFERAQIHNDMAQLKKLALDFLHPELPVKTSDGWATGRNYFTRPSSVGHTEHIHSQGHALNEVQPTVGGHEIHHFEDHEYYQYHVDNHLHSDHHDQSDHFEMDEDMAHDFREFRQSIHTMVPLKGADHPKESDEGNLSRSPSSVMLFEETSM